jgi:hypothetical protein
MGASLKTGQESNSPRTAYTDSYGNKAKKTMATKNTKRHKNEE